MDAEPELLEEDEANEGDAPPRIESGPDLQKAPCANASGPPEPFVIDDLADPRGGQLRTTRNDTIVGLPLQKTTFDTIVVGTAAETSVTQEFVNTFDGPIEVVYAFPLPHDAAVDEFWFRTGDRFIHSEIKRRAEAQEIYEEAKDAGKTAALLEQERPNIFTQHVANIPAGARIVVGTHLVGPVHVEDGAYELVLPTVIGPRYIPGTPVGARGTGVAQDTDRVPDASRISPPTSLRARCSDLEIHVTVDAGGPLAAIGTTTHHVHVDAASDVVEVMLEPRTAQLDRDFVLRWQLADRITATLLRDPGKEGYFAFTIQPPKAPPPERTVPRELVFVLDASGSMYGRPLEVAKDTVRRFLHSLRPDDAFAVLRFSDMASVLGTDAAPEGVGTLFENTPEHVARGLAYLDAIESEGGTEMIAGIRAALSLPHDPDRVRYVVFLTDGYIGNEREIFALLEDELQDTRLFSLGVGSAVHRYLLEGMARIGRGNVAYVDLEEDPEPIVQRFYAQLDRPALTDVSLDFGNAHVLDVVPARVPDVFAGQAVTVYGRFDGALGDTVTLHARRGREHVEIPVALASVRADRSEGLRSMWARRRIDELTFDPRMLGAPEAVRHKLEEKIVDLSLRHRVLTEFTAFVGVDDRVSVHEGTTTTVVQAVGLTHGMVEHFVTGGFGSAPAQEGSIGLGGIGTGGGGYGSGSGYGSGNGALGRSMRAPKITLAAATVKGSLDRAIIRRIVRAHMGEIRRCYNQGLVHDPRAAGRITIGFVIGPDGIVEAAAVEDSQLTDATIGACMAAAVKRWRFPRTEGNGRIQVHYPFMLSPPE